MPKPLLERDVDKLLVAECKKREIKTIKTVSVAHRGWPDRALIGPGKRFGLIEVKRKGGRTTRLQAELIAELQRAGVWVRILTGEATRRQTQLRIEWVLDSYGWKS